MMSRLFLFERVLVVCVAAVLVAIATGARAEAAAEFCPATVLGFHAVAEPGSGNASKTYGFKIGALGERTTSGTIAIETDKGWFTATFPSHHLYSSTHTQAVGGHSYDLTEFTEPTLFVQFPSSVVVARMWVAQASATGDGQFGWEARGSVSCEPSGAVVPNAFAGVWNAPDADEHPPTSFISPFAQPSVALVASSVETPVGSTCAQPFASPRIVDAAVPVWPDSIGVVFKKRSVSGIVAVALDARGGVVDAWPWAASQYPELDASEIAAAKATTYTTGVGLCRAVPSLLFFEYDWAKTPATPRVL